MSSRRGPVDPKGPFFISYRQEDGTEIAVALSWLLRGAGVPVWHDRSDLPPGDTSDRLDEAIASGLSGAVLLVTPRVEHSPIVRTIELPRLLALEPNRDFSMAIASTIRRDTDGKIDYEAADALLGSAPGSLGRLDQSPADTPEGLMKIVRGAFSHRLDRARREVEARGGVATISVQTRSTPHSQDNGGSDLALRFRPPASGRLPDRLGLMDAAATLPLLTEVTSRTGALAIRVNGGAHLSVAMGVGCALPSTHVGRLEVVDMEGQVWSARSVSAPAAPAAERLMKVGHGFGRAVGPSDRRPVLVYLDLLPSRSDAAYTNFLRAHPDEFAAWVHLRPLDAGPLESDQAGPLIEEAAYRLRDLVGQFNNVEVHVLLRTPWPVALLLGRLTNTLRVVAYEWDDEGDAGPHYVPSLRLRATAGGPITEVLLPE